MNIKSIFYIILAFMILLATGGLPSGQQRASLPAQEDRAPAALELPPAPFSKLTPYNQAAGQPVSVVLTWSAAGDAADYLYCIDDTPGESCDSEWVPTAETFAAPTGLKAETAYSWQVKAHNASGETAADGGTWWSFTTLADTPGSFSKLAPADDSGFESLTPWLYWTSSPGAQSYEYAIIENSPYPVEGDWIDAGSSLSVQVPASANLKPDTLYYWQVRGVQSGKPQANFGTLWSFTTLKAGPTSANQVFSDAVEDQPYTGSLTATSNYGKTFYLVGSPPPGDLVLASSGEFDYTPPQDFNGPVSFGFHVSDGYNPPSPTYQASIEVQPVNDPPVLSPIPDQEVDIGEPVSFTASATDADTPYGDQLTFSIVEPLPSGAVFDPQTGVFQWTATWIADQADGIILTVTVEDLEEAADTQVVKIYVTPKRIYLPEIKRR